jgi:hypothetical protein
MCSVTEKIKRVFRTSLFALLALLAYSCRTTRTVQIFDDYKEKVTIEAPELAADEDEAYIFFRLYNPCYSSPLNVTNLLKFGISTTNLSEIFVSHAAMGFDLNDNFYGVTLGGKQQLKLEICTDLSNNPYMRKCDPVSSELWVYAMKVPRDEYDATREMVQFFLDNIIVKYSVMQNFPYTGYNIKRKFFTSKKNQNFGNRKLTNKNYNIYKDLRPKKEPRYFVCSTFMAYVLMRNVESVRDLFIEKNINYRYVVPGDFTVFPGVIKLFYSSWEDYLIAAKKFVDENPDFAPYFNDKELSE